MKIYNHNDIVTTNREALIVHLMVQYIAMIAVVVVEMDYMSITR